MIDYVLPPKDVKLVFFGCYWQEDAFQLNLADNFIGLDYCIAKGGDLVAYRWNLEIKVANSHFASVG